MIKITSMNLFASNYPNSKQRGYGTITINDTLDIQVTIVMDSQGKLFVSWPQKPVVKDGVTKYSSQVNWNKDCSREIRDIITKSVVDEFNKIMILKDGNVPGAGLVKSTATSTPIRAGFHTIPVPSAASDLPFDTDEPLENTSIAAPPVEEKKKVAAVVWGKPKQN